MAHTKPIDERLSLSDVRFSLRAAHGAVRCAAAVVRTMGGGWWWARAARLARLRFRGALLPPPRPRSGGARGSFAPGHGPRAGASPPPVSELDRADAWLLRKAHETGLGLWLGSARMGEGDPHSRAVRAREWRMVVGFLLETGPGLRGEKGFRVSAGCKSVVCPHRRRACGWDRGSGLWGAVGIGEVGRARTGSLIKLRCLGGRGFQRGLWAGELPTRGGLVGGASSD